MAGAARFDGMAPLASQVRMIDIRPATVADRTNISVLAVSAFRQNNEAALIDALRAEGVMALEFVAEDAAGLVGHVALPWLRAPEGWLTLTPVCVRPEQQGEGIDGELIRHALDAARRAGALAVVAVGDPDYYHGFGFVFDGPSELASPYPSQYLGLYPIAPGVALARATLVYPRAFAGA